MNNEAFAKCAIVWGEKKVANVDQPILTVSQIYANRLGTYIIRRNVGGHSTELLKLWSSD